MEKIIFYTIGCPLCDVLEKALKRKNIEYTINTDRSLMLNKGYTKAPVLEIYHDDQMVEVLNFKEAMLRFGERENENENN